ncbi:MAG: hypothetical protein ACI9MR_001567 [Myxococcota bacterium]
METDPAFQCDLGQFQSLASWHNKDLGSDFMTLRMYVLHDYWRPVVAGDRYPMLGTKGRIAFDGAGYNSEYGDVCDVEVSAFQNNGAGANAGIQFTTSGCMLRTSADRTVFLAGTFGCTGNGWDLIAVDPPTDTTVDDTSGDANGDATDLVDADDGVNPDVADKDTLPVEDTTKPDPCAGDCTADETCVFATCVTCLTQTQSSRCSSPNDPCDGDDADCNTANVCNDNDLCERTSCQ